MRLAVPAGCDAIREDAEQRDDARATATAPGLASAPGSSHARASIEVRRGAGRPPPRAAGGRARDGRPGASLPVWSRLHVADRGRCARRLCRLQRCELAASSASARPSVPQRRRSQPRSGEPSSTMTSSTPASCPPDRSPGPGLGCRDDPRARTGRSRPERDERARDGDETAEPDPVTSGETIIRNPAAGG